MSFVEQKYADPTVVLRGAPGPSPWYLRDLPPRLPSGIKWSDMGDGKFLLTNSLQENLAIFNYYCYITPMSQDRLLVWHDAKGQADILPKQMNHTKFSILDLRKLSPIPDLPDVLNLLNEEKLYCYYLEENAESFLFRRSLDAGEHSIEIPDAMNEFDELLFLGYSWANFCIFILKPKQAKVEVFPQHWFNNSNLDFGYQCVTRVARDPESRKIYGEGIRISHFVLDDSNREVEKWFHDDPFFEAVTKINN